MRRAKLGKKVWGFLSIVLLLGGGTFLGGCSEAKSTAGPQTPGGHGQAAQAAQAGGSQDFQESPSISSSSANSESAPPAPPGLAPPVRPAPAPPPADEPRSSSSPKKSSSSAGSTASADAAPASKSPSPTTPAPEPSTRPGLGTEFGEARVSRVHDVSFVRDGSRPFAIAAMNYNDKRGVDALASAARSHETGRSLSAASGAVTISIRDASGNALETVRAGERTLVVGQAGQRYAIVLENHTSHRFEAVGTVDGLDVINGKAGTFDNRGYVLMPFATLTIDGFRTSTASVAAFRFATVADSYAAQTGSARNVGVIGMAFFSERGDAFVPESETRLRETASPFPADPRFASPPPGR